MALKEEFEKNGNWLFRWRSYLPLIMLGFILLALREYRYPGNSETLDIIWECCCLAVSCLGLAIRVYTVGCAPYRTSGRNTRSQVAETLNTNGAYSMVRNPLYLGNFFMGLGVVLFAHLWWLTLIYLLSFWLYYERIIFAEEAFLRRKFGTVYLDWAETTPVFIPQFKLYRRAELRFSLRNAMKREYNGFFALVAVMFLLETAGDFAVTGKVEIDSAWLFLLESAFFVWLVLRTLKKHTTWLQVPGR